MDILINAQSVRYGQEQRIHFLYRFILRQFFNKLIGLCCITPSKDRPLVSFNITEAVGPFCLLSKVIPVLLSYQCKNGAAYRNPWFVLVPGFFPGFFYIA